MHIQKNTQIRVWLVGFAQSALTLAPITWPSPQQPPPFPLSEGDHYPDF